MVHNACAVAGKVMTFLSYRNFGTLFRAPWLKKYCCHVTKASYSSIPGDSFNPHRVLILTKFSRYEFEKIRHSDIQDELELEKVLRERGSDFNALLYHHYIHQGCHSRVEKAFQDHGVETKVVNRFNYTDENIEWADLVVTTGGDGTFLMAANRIQDRQKPIIGFNTDPTRSIGYLCLPKKYSINVHDAVSKLFQNKFKWTFRRRIRLTLIGENVFDSPVELHDQQLSHPEYRFLDCLQEQHKSVSLDYLHSIEETLRRNKKLSKRVLPVLALNEVYLGECVSARVSYFEVFTSKMTERVKTKNAGICVSTGTGSTSWNYNMNKISPEMVRDILKTVDKELTPKTAPLTINPQNTPLSSNLPLIDRVVQNYNSSLIFDPESNDMLYTIRDPVTSHTLPYASEIISRDFVSRMEVKSRCFDACLVIDGGLSFSFNDGTMVILEMHEEDALKTVVSFEDDEN